MVDRVASLAVRAAFAILLLIDIVRDWIGKESVIHENNIYMLLIFIVIMLFEISDRIKKSG